MKATGRTLAALVTLALAAGTAACGTATRQAGTPPPQPGGAAPGQGAPGPGAPTPPRPTAHAQIAAGCPAARTGAKETWITDSTGAGIGALELGTGPKGVVLAHMAGGDSCQWLPFGQQLAAAGYHVVVFDFGGSGVSDPLAGQDRRDANVIGAAAYLHGHGALNVVLVGASMGGTAALVAANEVSPAVHGVVSLSAPASYQGLDAAAAVKKLSAPVLYIAGTGDGQYASAARALYADTPGKAKTLLLASGAQHGTMLLAKQEADAARVRTAILDFLKQTLS